MRALRSLWRGMLARCRNRRAPNYAHYGGRGIHVCRRWSRFENFAADMGPRPRGTSLERIDNDGHYEPRNCRWATRSEQMRNTRRAIAIGTRFGRLVVIGAGDTDKNSHLRFVCRCDCGGTHTVLGTNLRQGTTSSCGCARRSHSTNRSNK